MKPHPAEPNRWVADAQVPRSDAPNRPLVHVAVGVLVDAAGRFLLTSRPPGKVYEGYWEFPGGKLEAGESVDEALSRELEEELGIHITQQTAWRTTQVDYPHALVALHFQKVTAWLGQPAMREGQLCAWQTLPVTVSPVLPGTLPVLAWLEAEQSQEAPPGFIKNKS